MSRALPPGLMISAPASGAGKTTVTLGLLRAWTMAGRKVQPFKSGPDYIDPAFHRAASGRVSLNLDSWAMGGAMLGVLAARAEGADLALAEGSMGLFDGVASRGATDNGSSASIARRMGWPVVLVLDVSGQAQTAAAGASGFAHYPGAPKLAGVILNRVASPRHERLARLGMEAAGLRVFGALPRRIDLTLPERHLGLVQAAEHPDLDRAIAEYAAFLSDHVDLDALEAAAREGSGAPEQRAEGAAADGRGDGSQAVLTSSRSAEASDESGRSLGAGEAPNPAGQSAITTGRREPAESAPAARDPHTQRAAAEDSGASSAGQPAQVKGGASISTPQPAQTPTAASTPPPPGRRIALAQDAAFSFIYPHLLAAWEAAGAQILPFSPLADEAPDPSADLVWLPGGYPELHAARLAGAARFHAALRDHAKTRPVHGECGGYMALGAALIDKDGARHQMAGLLGLVTSYEKRKMHLGYRMARLLAPSPGFAAGASLRGHEFHYSTIIEQPDPPLARVCDADGNEIPETGSVRGHVTGTFFHLIAGAA
ncbi:MAG: cobyrinate a,c-diamide synthase [Paracoccus sp. (in: a-proteobacteria)]|nr:cobyrinate a,c-diamide synthase [Paracoccus sp. (in: a-proteobacteria)]